MGTIVERTRRNGKKSYTAQIRIMRDGEKVHTEAQTFDRRPAAAAWLKKRETALSEPGALEKLKEPQSTLGDAIDRYLKESKKAMGRTKRLTLEKIRDEFEIAKKDCKTIGSAEIVEFATELSEGERQPQTVGNYMSHLSSVFAIARPAWKIDLDYSAMEDAQVVMKRLGLVSKSAQRDRRPTLEELDKLMEHYSDREKRYDWMTPMRRLILFAIFSTRRQEEISRITWTDFEKEHKRVLIRDMKNPGEKIGNDVWCDLTPEAIRVIGAMPKVEREIFPYEGRSVSNSFTKACAILGIDDLHFHDLRHEGISRLFELGWNIPHVATVSGHKSWGSLKRYSHIKQRGDKYEGWKWLDVIAPANP